MREDLPLKGRLIKKRYARLKARPDTSKSNRQIT